MKIDQHSAPCPIRGWRNVPNMELTRMLSEVKESVPRHQVSGHLHRGRAQTWNFAFDGTQQFKKSRANAHPHGIENDEPNSHVIRLEIESFRGPIPELFIQRNGFLGDLHHAIPGLRVLLQKAQKDENALNASTTFQHGHREVDREPCQIARLYETRLFEQIFNCSAVVKPLRQELGQIMHVVCESKVVAETLLSQVKDDRNQNSEERDSCSRPCAHCGNCVPPDHTVIYTQLVASKDPIPFAHSLNPLWTGGHSATRRDTISQPATLANVKPPRDRRTRLREDV